jgi:hypothetical protein
MTEEAPDLLSIVEALLDGIRDEVREAVIEGDANDCSSPDCIADAVYEIVRVRLRDAALPATEPVAADLRFDPSTWPTLSTTCQWHRMEIAEGWVRAALSTEREEPLGG